jgi:toxin ParE1/3/4
MARFVVTRAAEADLADVGRFTRERWGDEQFRQYLARLDARFRLLAKDPSQGRACDDIRRGYLRYHEGKHVIFNRFNRGLLEIVRVLHERMLPELHL